MTRADQKGVLPREAEKRDHRPLPLLRPHLHRGPLPGHPGHLPGLPPGEPLGGQELSYRVDGGERQNGTTDENGILRITLSDGAHGVRLADTQQEIYIDNYSGFGITVDEYREQPSLTFLADGSCAPVDGEQTEENASAEITTEESTGETAESPEPAAKTGENLPVVPIAVVVILAAATAVIWRKRQNQK